MQNEKIMDDASIDHSSNNLIGLVIAKHQKMLDLLDRMKVKVSGFRTIIPKRLAEADVPSFQAFMDSLFENEYAELYRIWTLPHISDEMWHRYRVLNITGLPEQVSLDHAFSAFRNKIKSFQKEHRHAKRQKTAAKRAKRIADNS